jgi:hypothetical protein
MKKSALGLAVLILSSALFTGCKDDLEVNAPYENITIVYALLDKSEDTNYVKINKAFLGEGNAFEYAQVPDSSEYRDDQLTAVLQEIDGSNNVVNTLPLQPIILERPLGIFYGPEHKVYYTTTPLNEDHRYRLVANASGNEITASTRIVGSFQIYATTVNVGSKINFVNPGPVYQPYEIKWTSGPNGKRYEVSYEFFYDVITSDNDTIHRSFENYIDQRISDGGADQLSVTMNGETFYQTVRNRLLQDGDQNVLKRKFVGIDLKWAVAGLDLNTYLQLQNPISGVVEDRPDYSNVEGGYGLFSSRFFDSVRKHNNGQMKRLSDPSLDELINGQYTAELQFEL